MLPQYGKGFFCYGSGDRLCCKIEDIFAHSCADCSYRWKNRRHGFAYACRCLNKNLAFCGYRMVYTGYDFPLSLPIFKRKLQITHGCISFFFPCKLIGDPFVISVQQILIPLSEFFQRMVFPEISKFLCIQISVGHLHSDLLKLLLLCIDPRIAHCLGTVDFYRLLKLADICINALNLINVILVIFCEYSVSSALYLNVHIFVFCYIFQGNLCSVVASHTALYLSVKSAAFQHCFFVRRTSAVVKVTAFQYKLHQISDGNANQRFLHVCLLHPKSYFSSPYE